MKTPRFAVALALCAGAASPVALAPVACAGEGDRAALVVDTGAAVTTYCVALPDGSVSGIELVELAGDQHGLDYSLGFGGEAVCRLEGVGPEGDDCFGDYPEFWGYWHGNGSGGWTWAGTGAGSATIEDGDVDAWSWGAGDNGSNHQAPPRTQYGDVCPVVDEPAPAKGRQRPKGARGAGRDAPSSPGAGAPAPVAAAAEAEVTPEPAKDGTKKSRGPRRPRKVRERGDDRVTEVPSPVPPPLATSVAAEPASDEAGGGPPLTGLLGLAAAGALGAVVWRGSRRKTRV